MMLKAACVAIRRPVSSARATVFFSRSMVVVHTRRGTRIPRMRPLTLPSCCLIHSVATLKPVIPLLVMNAFKTSLLVADPMTGIITGRKIGARAKAFHLLEQGVLHHDLRAELGEGGDTAADQLDDRVGRIEVERPFGGRFAMSKPTCIPGHLFPAPRNRHFEKRLPKEKRPTRVGDQPMRRTMSVVNVSIDKTGSDELVAGINLTVDCSVKT